MKYFLNSKSDIYGMARVGYTKENYEIYVNTDDGGNIPHFHIRLKDDWNKFHSCIMIEDAKYFEHQGKESKLNSREKKNLEDFMNAKVLLSRYKDKFNNNWELICFLWDSNNSDMLINENTIQPDYTKL